MTYSELTWFTIGIQKHLNSRVPSSSLDEISERINVSRNGVLGNKFCLQKSAEHDKHHHDKETESKKRVLRSSER